MYQEVFRLHAEIMKALANPKRLEIVHLLRNQELSVSQIQLMLDLPQANLSQHLMVLRNAKIVKTKKNGKQVKYSLSDNKFIEACDLIRSVLIQRYKNSDIADDLTLKMSQLVPVSEDPVCGMRVSPKTASFAHKYKNKTHYFCASGCLEEFKKKPEKFIS